MSVCVDAVCPAHHYSSMPKTQRQISLPMVYFPVVGRSAYLSKNALLQLLLLSTCTTINNRGAVAFVAPQMRKCTGVSASIRRCNRRNAPPEQPGHSSRWPRQQQQCSLPRAAAEGPGGGAGGEGGAGKRGGDDGAASGMGLEGEWEVKSGEVRPSLTSCQRSRGRTAVATTTTAVDMVTWVERWMRPLAVVRVYIFV